MGKFLAQQGDLLILNERFLGYQEKHLLSTTSISSHLRYILNVWLFSYLKFAYDTKIGHEIGANVPIYIHGIERTI